MPCTYDKRERSECRKCLGKPGKGATRELFVQTNIMLTAAERFLSPRAIEPRITPRETSMRTLELIAAVIVALVVFVAIKLIGVVLHIALIGAAIGLFAGFLLARAFRQT